MGNGRTNPDQPIDERKQRAQRLQDSAQVVADQFDADILFFNGGLDPGIDNVVMNKVGARRRRKNVILILATLGGNADCAFRIARCLQALYETFTAVVPGWCKSAGTLLCIGAHELVIGDLGELGPLDVQVAKPDELGLISSGLTIDSAFRSLQSVAFQMFERFLLDVLTKSGGRITTKTAAELSANITVGLLSPIFEQLDPIKIGEDFRSTRIAEHYALRLTAHTRNMIIDPPDMDAIEMLVRGYPSHGFVIDRTEAKQLFHRVSPLDGALADVVSALGDALTPIYGQEPIIQYLTQEVKDDERTGRNEVTPARGKSPRRKKSTDHPEGGGTVSGNLQKGDGNIALSVANKPARTGGHSKEAN